MTNALKVGNPVKNEKIPLKMCAIRQIINNAWAGIKLPIEVPPPDTSENQKSGNSRRKSPASKG